VRLRVDCFIASCLRGAFPLTPLGVCLVRAMIVVDNGMQNPSFLKDDAC